MDYLKLNENVCRICLGHNIKINWNDEIDEFFGMSYKDCYYKYTQLEKSDLDPFPTNLCELCAIELKNSHSLFKKALESFKILEVALKAKELSTERQDIVIRISQSPIQDQIETFEYSISNEISAIDSPTDAKILIDIEDEMYLTNVYDSGTLAETENAINNSKELAKSEDDAVEPVHFIEIQNYDSSDDRSDLLEQKASQGFDVNLKSSASKKAGNKRKKVNSSAKTLLQEKESQCIDTKSSISDKAGKERKKGETSARTIPEQKLNSGDADASTPSTTNKAGKIRKKNLLMCAYCSLKVDGTNQLKKHEATHSENRKRTETCPQCGVKLYTKLSLNNHMKIHEANRQKNYKCEFCEKAFFNRGALNVHRRIHLGLMVTCQICSKEYYRQVDLNKHLLMHSASPLQKNVEKIKYEVQCQYCNKSVLTSKWKEHKAAHLDQPQVKCKICDKKFFARSKCSKHLRQVHRKTKSEYEEFTHYYVNCNTRLSNLAIQQQEKVKALRVKSIQAPQ